MDIKILSTILDAGMGVVAIATISWLFWQSQKSHKDERESWRLSSEKRDERITQALDALSESLKKP